MSEALKTSKTQLQRREEAISKILDSAITLISEVKNGVVILKDG